MLREAPNSVETTLETPEKIEEDEAQDAWWEWMNIWNNFVIFGQLEANKNNDMSISQNCKLWIKLELWRRKKLMHTVAIIQQLTQMQIACIN